MTKKIAVVAIILVFVLGATAFAADQFGVGKTRTVTFSTEVKVGDKVLPAGDYKILHLMEGSDHTLVFKSAENNKEKIRVKCTMQDLGKKAPDSLSEFKTVDNQKVLTGLVFQGDTFRHSF